MIDGVEVIDACVYHDWDSQDEVVDFMPDAWQSYVGRTNSIRAGVGARPLAIERPYRNPLGDILAESSATGYPGSLGVTSVEDARTGRGIDTAILVYGRGLFVTADSNPQLTVAVCRAMNDWSVDRWLTDGDDRLYGSVIAPNQSPSEAADEVRRLAKSGRVAQVLMTGNGLGVPFGHPLYHPIYEAAAELGLPVTIHIGGDATADTATQVAAVGPPSTYSEYRALSSQALFTHAITLIGQGVFDLYPDLKVLLVGGGLGWLPSSLWRANLEYRAWASSAPWVKRLPSEYFFQHFWFSTYQIDLSPPESLGRLFRALPVLQERLVYASGYPAGDSLTPEAVARLLPDGWAPRVFRDNARELFGPRIFGPNGP